MKTLLRAAACLFLFLITKNIDAQVTQLSNNTNIRESITLGNKALLETDKDSIWVTDGTAAGTFKLRNDVATTGEAVVYKNKIYAGGITAAKGAELWVSDCTTAGTKLFKDINTGAASSFPTQFFVFNDLLFFYAITKNNGYELWKTDGTASGTVMVKDIYAGKGSSYDSTSSNFFYPVNGLLFFQANDSIHGNELWKTNGTTGGTTLVKDLNPGKNSLQISTYNALNNQFIFSGKDNTTTGIKIWQTNGTSAGTAVIKTLLPTSGNTYINAQSLSKFKNKLVFALEGFSFPQFVMVNQLYTTDATSNGTILLKDLGDSSLGFSFGTLAPTIKNKFYFTTYSAKGSLLWESDATPGGTKITKTIGTKLNLNKAHIPIIITDFLFSNPDSAGSKTFNNKLFIAADDGIHGYEPWITNGISNGTKLIKDIYKDTGSSLSLSAFSFVYSKQGLYFSANNNKTGNELWLSDATAGGTVQIANINPGKKSSNPLFMGVLKNHLLFSADDGDNSKGKRDLYQLDATFDILNVAQASEAVAVNAAPDGSTFSVYPNPAKNQLNVRLDKNIMSQHISLAITNQKGQQMYSQEINTMQASGVYTIDISRLTQGAYYLEVITDKGISSNRFIKVNR